MCALPEARPDPGGLLADEPGPEPEVAFGCAATVLVEDRLARHIRGAGEQGRSALRERLA